MHVQTRFFTGFFAISALLCSPAAVAEKTDIVTLENGDRLTGEIIALRNGLLEFSTDTMGTVQIEWDGVAGLESRFVHEVDLESGARYFGSLPAAAESGRVAVRAGAGQVESLPVAETIRISPIDTTGSITKLFDGYVDFGFSYSEATSVNQLSVGAGVSRRGFDRLSSLDFSLVESDAPETESASTSSLTGEIRNFLGNRQFWSGFGRLETNDSLGLDLRTLVGAGVGQYFVQSNRRVFAGMIGLAGTKENFSDGEEEESVEGFLGVQYDGFRFHSPEWSLSASLGVFPSLTIDGRIRTATSLRFRYEILTDLFAQLSLTHSYDSKPQADGAEKVDYTLTTSLGYKF